MHETTLFSLYSPYVFSLTLMQMSVEHVNSDIDHRICLEGSVVAFSLGFLIYHFLFIYFFFNNLLTQSKISKHLTFIV